MQINCKSVKSADMTNGLLLWADDEMELLRAHLLFLEKKGYEVVTVTNGTDAIEECKKRTFDLVLLDEMMPGLSQILLTLKKNIHRKEIITETVQTGYQQQFQQLSMQIMDCSTWQDWTNVYKRLVRWELELSATDSQMTEMLEMQKEEANRGFAKFVKQNYLEWLEVRSERLEAREMSKPSFLAKSNLSPLTSHPSPLLSPDVFKNKVFPVLSEGKKVFLIVLDNFRYDQWKMLEREIGDLFDIDEDVYCSILPTATQYARNAIFSGLMPIQIAQMFPDLWVDEDEEEGKNLNEEPLIQTQLERYRKRNTFSYHKINTSAEADKLVSQLNTLEKNDLNVVVFNFIDMLSHARTESKMVRELANNESAYRSITLSWFRHSLSPLTTVASVPPIL